MSKLYFGSKSSRVADPDTVVLYCRIWIRIRPNTCQLPSSFLRIQIFFIESDPNLFFRIQIRSFWARIRKARARKPYRKQHMEPRVQDSDLHTLTKIVKNKPIKASVTFIFNFLIFLYRYSFFSLRNNF